jgi:hypothetical protein
MPRKKYTYQELKKLRDEVMHLYYNIGRNWDNRGKRYPYIDRETKKNYTEKQYVKIRDKFYDLDRRVREIEQNKRKELSAKLEGLVTAFLVMDKRQNPDLYPDWLSFKIDGSYGGIDYNPVINWEKWTSTDRPNTSNKIQSIRWRIQKFWNMYIQPEISVSINSSNYPRFEPYGAFQSFMKDEVNKKLKPKLKSLYGRALSSLIFRMRENGRFIIQIQPRISRNIYRSWSYESQIEKTIRDFLSEYGLKENQHYQFSGSKD